MNAPALRPRILLVDDEQQVTQGLGMVLRRSYEVVAASSGEEGLRRAAEEGPFAVIVSDMRMPGMNGAEFLARARAIAPDATRVMLSGQADLDAVVSAINEGGVFRFLAKPCAPSLVRKVLQEAVEHHHAVESERALVRTNLRHSADVLVECLGLIHPLAAAQSHRIEEVVRAVLPALGLEDTFDLEVAASLAWLGTLPLPAHLLGLVAVGATLDAEDQDVWRSHARIGADLVAALPGLEGPAEMLRAQMSAPSPASVVGAPREWPRARLGAELLRLANDLLTEVRRAGDQALGLHELRAAKRHPAALLEALAAAALEPLGGETSAVRAEALAPGMVLEEDLCSRSGAIIAVRGTKANGTLVRLVQNYASRGGIREPVQVRLPGRRDPGADDSTRAATPPAA